DRKDLPLETRIQFSHLYANALKFRACGARCDVHIACGDVGEGALPSDIRLAAVTARMFDEYFTSGSPIERRTAEALCRRSRTSAAKPGLAKYCVRSTIIVALVGIIVPCPNADADGTTGSAAAPADRCRNCRRGSFILYIHP